MTVPGFFAEYGLEGATRHYLTLGSEETGGPGWDLAMATNVYRTMAGISEAGNVYDPTRPAVRRDGRGSGCVGGPPYMPCLKQGSQPVCADGIWGGAGAPQGTLCWSQYPEMGYQGICSGGGAPGGRGGLPPSPGYCDPCPTGTTLCISGNTGVCCPGVAECERGNCHCPNGEVFCNSQCVDTQTDPRNCGFCDKACQAGQVCCSGSCTDISSDSNNCGACGSTCQQGDGTCCGGRCCPERYGTCCNGQCCPDPFFCCGSSCCSNGELGGEPQACCNGSCQPQDEQHCGFSCQSCTGGQTCQLDPSQGYHGYACLCSSGETLSNGLCCPSGQTNCNGNCVAPPGAGALSSNSNFMLSNNCVSIAGPNGSLKVSLLAGTEDLVSENGFSFQLNGFPPPLTPTSPNGCPSSADFCCMAPTGVCIMQYIIRVSGNNVSPWIQYFQNSGVENPNNDPFATLPAGKANTLPAGWALEITLENDENGNVDGIILSVIDNTGHTVGCADQGQTGSCQQMPMPVDPNSGLPLLFANLAFSAVAVALPGSSEAKFTSGGGCITYEVSEGQLCETQDNCTNFDAGTTEQSNASYGALSATCGSSLSQSVTTSDAS